LAPCAAIETGSHSRPRVQAALIVAGDDREGPIAEEDAQRWLAGVDEPVMNQFFDAMISRYAEFPPFRKCRPRYPR
jgi:hypothetical protein